MSRDQARNQESAGGANPLKNLSPPLKKCVGYSLKILHVV